MSGASFARRCTAVLIASIMILSVYMPHCVCDEENYIVELKVVRSITEEGKKLGPKDFFMGGTSLLSSNLRVMTRNSSGQP